MMQRVNARKRRKKYTIHDVLIVMTIEKYYDNEQRNASREILYTLLLRSRVR